MTQSEKVEVLFKEYDTLRVEILQRSSQRFQFLAIAGAIGAFALFRTSPLTSGQAVALIAACNIVLCVWWRLGQCIARCSMRIAEIEQRINDLAGEKLLHWEGALVGRSFFHRLHSTKKECQQRDGG
ncbi:MAG: hypothetical protein WCV00_00155 [Verrucomicrobiia bacterium]|jgi:hypothetical protein